jgi:maleate isomerase
MVMGMSSETFWGGAEGNDAFTQRLRDLSGVEVTTGATACKQALDALGVGRLAVITPYQAVGDEQVYRYFEDIGAQIVRLRGLRCENATSPAKVTEETLRQVIAELDGPDVDAVVQVGTNLSMVSLADRAEREIGKPVIAINAAILWSALRAYGISDRYSGHGVLLREH